MKSLVLSVLSAAAIAVVATAAPAQTPTGAGRALFQQADVNNDGRLSRVEYLLYGIIALVAVIVLGSMFGSF